MTRAWSTNAVAAALAAAFALGPPCGPLPATAAIETDPAALYATMKQAYETGESHSWPFVDEVYYFSTILDAGRAYALFRPSDPQYGEVAELTVSVAQRLHYDPLTNNDAADWYVREAAAWTSAHGDDTQSPAARELIERLQSEDADLSRAAAVAVADATANSQTFSRDGDALAALAVADVRAFDLTHDTSFRSALLHDMANPDMPLVRIPDPEFGRAFEIVNAALAGGDSYSDADRDNAHIIDDRRKRTPDLQVIARVHAIPHDLRLTRTAPADEYFGNQKMSPLGVRNEMNRINRYLDAGWGDRMTKDALNVANSVNDWQHQYPRDYTLPQNLLDTYHLLQRIDSSETHAEASKVRNVLVVEYPGSHQARELSPS
jgi:hypothetical protein